MITVDESIRILEADDDNEIANSSFEHVSVYEVNLNSIHLN